MTRQKRMWLTRSAVATALILVAASLVVPGCDDRDDEVGEIEDRPNPQMTRTDLNDDQDLDRDVPPARRGDVPDRTFQSRDADAAAGTFGAGHAIALEFEGPDTVRAGEPYDISLTVRNTADYPVHNVVVYELPSGQKQDQRQRGPQPQGNRPNQDRPDAEAGRLPNQNRPDAEAGRRPNQDRPDAEAGRRPDQNRPDAEAGRLPNQNRPDAEAGRRPNQDRPDAEAGRRPDQNRPDAEAGRLPNQNRPDAEAGRRPNQDRPDAEAGRRPMDRPDAEAGRRPMDRPDPLARHRMNAQQGMQQQAMHDQGVGHRIGMLQPGQSKTIQISGAAYSEGQTQLCFSVDYDPVICHTLEVVKPEISLARRYVDEEGNPVDTVYSCDPLFLEYEIRNTGTGTTQQIRFQEQLPQGLQTAEGQAEVSRDIEAIEAGESERVRVELGNLQAGEYAGRAMVRTGQLQARSQEGQVVIMHPTIELQADGPQQALIGQSFAYTFRVRNTSQWPAIETAVELPDLPVQPQLQSRQMSIEDGRIQIGRLGPNESREFTLMFSPDQVGQIQGTARAVAYCAEAAEAVIQTQIAGLPALQLEVVDEGDTFPVGQEFAYQINVLNEGTAKDLTIQLRGQLPEGMEFVRGEGPTKISGDGQNIRFEPLAELAPGDEATWQVFVKGTQPGKFQRFRLQMASQTQKQPVFESEPTTIFARQAN